MARADIGAMYRVAPADKTLFSGKELMNAITHDFASPTIPDSELPFGEWYCQSEACVVREVTIYCKLHGEPMPQQMKCPACGEVLKFHNWIDSETLLMINARTDFHE